MKFRSAPFLSFLFSSSRSATNYDNLLVASSKTAAGTHSTRERERTRLFGFPFPPFGPKHISTLNHIITSFQINSEYTTAQIRIPVPPWSHHYWVKQAQICTAAAIHATTYASIPTSHTQPNVTNTQGKFWDVGVFPFWHTDIRIKSIKVKRSTIWHDTLPLTLPINL